ncbi:hypothetical protein Tco_1042008 [Tanacetum coccineum]|uniref:Uncharacterized protein n=1 Tax=Tanacetum coccineum TaxID=301880 RepID=A0ABQ5GHS5_9ASTR
MHDTSDITLIGSSQELSKDEEIDCITSWSDKLISIANTWDADINVFAANAPNAKIGSVVIEECDDRPGLSVGIYDYSPIQLLNDAVMRLSLDFKNMFYNSLGSAPNHCSVV